MNISIDSDLWLDLVVAKLAALHSSELSDVFTAMDSVWALIPI